MIEPLTYLSTSSERYAYSKSTLKEKFNKSVSTRTIIIPAVAISLVLFLSIIVNEGFPDTLDIAYAQIEQEQQSSSPESSPNSSAAATNKVTIDLSSVKFVPLDYDDANQLKVVVDYKTNDPALVNTPMAGTMKVYQPNGTVLKSSSIQKGYIVGESGSIQFATSFTDKTIQDVKADIYLTDTQHSDKISNTLTTKASLLK